MKLRNRCWSVGLLGLILAIGLGCAPKPKPKQAPQMDSMTRARLAESMLNAGRVSDALDEIDEAIAADPDNGALYHFRGTIFFRAGRYAEAAAAFEKALEVDPFYTDAHNFLGSTYAELGRPNEAEAEYRKALADPAYPSPELVYFNLALLFARQGRDEDALSQLRRAVEIDPKFYQAHFELASTLDRMDRLDEAAREYEVAEPGFRNSADYYYRLGLAYFKLGDAEKSREKLRRAIDVGPGSESAARAGDLLRMLP